MDPRQQNGIRPRSMYDVQRTQRQDSRPRPADPYRGQTPRMQQTQARQQTPNPRGSMYSVPAAQRQRLARLRRETELYRQTPRPQTPGGGMYGVPGRNPGAFPGQDPVGAVRQDPSSAANQTAVPRTPSYGTRVGAVPGNTHASYRTADGRIIDGFDKSGRPIYRDPGSGTGDIVRRAAFTPENLRNLHPTRYVRVETLADTEVKPFPWKTVLIVLFCTVLSMAVLYTYMELNECTNTISTLTYRQSSLRSRYNTLAAEVVQREDLIAIEETAANTLGMVKNDVLTKRYVTIENEDKTEVVAKKRSEEAMRTSVEIDLKTGKPIEDENGGT